MRSESNEVKQTGEKYGPISAARKNEVSNQTLNRKWGRWEKNLINTRTRASMWSNREGKEQSFSLTVEENSTCLQEKEKDGEKD